MPPLLLFALIGGGVAFALSALNRAASTPPEYGKGETADRIWNEYLKQHGSAPQGTTMTTGPGLTTPPDVAEARA
jgi:hypothetical protein